MADAHDKLECVHLIDAHNCRHGAEPIQKSSDAIGFSISDGDFQNFECSRAI